MRLIASLIVRDELSRFLPEVMESLLGFCDEVRAVDDGSTDGTFEFLAGIDGVEVIRNPASTFFVHEGQARQALLEHSLRGKPTHVLAIDADEFIDDGPALRDLVANDHGIGVWKLAMQEVWKADAAKLWIRRDHAWKDRHVPILYRTQLRRHLGHIRSRQLSSGREPTGVIRLASRGEQTDLAVLHFGWTCEADRQERYERYAKHDGGRFHASAHLESIMWSDDEVTLESRSWPGALDIVKDDLLDRVNRG